MREHGLGGVPRGPNLHQAPWVHRPGTVRLGRSTAEAPRPPVRLLLIEVNEGVFDRRLHRRQRLEAARRLWEMGTLQVLTTDTGRHGMTWLWVTPREPFAWEKW